MRVGPAAHRAERPSRRGRARRSRRARGRARPRFGRGGVVQQRDVPDADRRRLQRERDRRTLTALPVGPEGPIRRAPYHGPAAAEREREPQSRPGPTEDDERRHDGQQHDVLRHVDGDPRVRRPVERRLEDDERGHDAAVEAQASRHTRTRPRRPSAYNAAAAPHTSEGAVTSLVPLPGMVALFSPAITRRRSPPTPLPRRPALAAGACGLRLGAPDREPRPHSRKEH